MEKSPLKKISAVFAIIGVIASIIFGINSWKSKSDRKELPSIDESKKIEIDKIDNSEVIIGDNTVVDKSTRNYYSSKNKYDPTKIIGVWRSSETWTKLFVRMYINSEVSFYRNSSFVCKSRFSLEGIDHFFAIYEGTWTIKDDMILYSNFNLDSLKNYEQAGNNEMLSAMILKEYLNVNNQVKIENIKSYSDDLIRTEWKKDNSLIEKLYQKK